MPPSSESALMATLSIQRARQLLGDETYRLSDAEIQAKIDTMMVFANRVYDVLERKNTSKVEHEPVTANTQA